MVAKEMCFFNKIDSLDTLALLGDRDRFATSIEWIGKIFALILVLGGLLSAHLIVNDYATGCDDWCRSKL
ncbi:hypothetical protein AAHE18_15G273100 [Arachis hypogaea]